MYEVMSRPPNGSCAIGRPVAAQAGTGRRVQSVSQQQDAPCATQHDATQHNTAQQGATHGGTSSVTHLLRSGGNRVAIKHRNRRRHTLA